MGLFDRFKKKQEPMAEQKPQPLTLQYSDGTVAEITFNGTVDVDGKIAHSAHVVYIDNDGSFTSRSLLLEPIIVEQNGQNVDSTELYYRSMADRDGSEEAGQRYGVLKGFFKKQEITQQKMGSDYIGRVAKNERGEYYRDFDHQFKAKQTQKNMEENQAREASRLQREDEFATNLKNQVYDKPVNIKTSHAEHLTPEKNPYANR